MRIIRISKDCSLEGVIELLNLMNLSVHGAELEKNISSIPGVSVIESDPIVVGGGKEVGCRGVSHPVDIEGQNTNAEGFFCQKMST